MDKKAKCKYCGEEFYKKVAYQKFCREQCCSDWHKENILRKRAEKSDNTYTWVLDMETYTWSEKDG